MTGTTTATEPASLELWAGAPRPVRLRYVRDGPLFYVIPAKGDTGWFYRAAHRGAARVRWDDRAPVECAASVRFESAEVARVGELFRSKYGAELWQKHFDAVPRVLRLEPGRAPSAPTPEAVLRTEFDSVARGYDRSLARKPIERYLKDVVAAEFSATLAGFDPLLEVGSGTGYHTLRLLAEGHRVVAVDVSQEMLGELRRRADEGGWSDRLETRRGRLCDLGELFPASEGRLFRGAYSAFGAFNLEPDLARARVALARLVAPGGRLTFTSLNRPGLVPMAWDLLLGRPAAAFRRTSPIIPTGGMRYPLEVHPRSPAGWEDLLGEPFRRLRARPVSVLAPPFDSERLLSYLGTRGRPRARRLDQRLASRAGWAFAAEWVLLEFERRAEASPAEARG